MGQQLCVSRVELEDHQNGFHPIKDKLPIKKSKSHEDSIIKLPYQENSREHSVKVEDAPSEQIIEDNLGLLPSSYQQQDTIRQYQYGERRIQKEYAQTFEPNDIDLSKSDCPKENSIQDKCRLVMTSNQGTSLIPSSPTKPYGTNYQLRKESYQSRSEYADTMSQYLIVSCPNGLADHFYSKNNKQQCKSQTLQQRIESELQSLKVQLNSYLDCQDESCAFVFFDGQDLRFIRCMITGPAQSVFAYGVYVFDIYIPEDYPYQPPRVHLKQCNPKFGRSSRMAPYLLEDGRVCLDILGIYLGIEKDSSNQWDSNTSTLGQVIEAMRNEIFCQDVYRSAQLAEGEKESKNDENLSSHLYSTASSVNMNDLTYAVGYENVLRYITMTQAIQEMLEQQQLGGIDLENVINQHFVLCAEKIMQKIQLWIKIQRKTQQDNPPMYSGLIELHNRGVAMLLQQKGFVACAEGALKEIEMIFMKKQNDQKSKEDSK